MSELGFIWKQMTDQLNKKAVPGTPDTAFKAV